MKRINVGQTITILANLGVIAGIVFLAVELEQNQNSIDVQNALNLAETRAEVGQVFNGFRRMLIEDRQLIPIWERGFDGEELTTEEQAVFGYICSYRVWTIINVTVRMDALGLEQESRQMVNILAGDARQSDAFAHCWEEARQSAINSGYQDLVDRVEARRNR